MYIYIIVYATFIIENVVLGKAIQCSKTLEDDELLCTAAIDGSTSSRASLQVANSGPFEGLYGLLVDLGSVFVIQSYQVTARNAWGCCYEGLRNVTIEVLDSSQTIVTSVRDPDWVPTSGASNSQPLIGIGRYIRLYSDGGYIKQGESTLDFNELQVFGYKNQEQSSAEWSLWNDSSCTKHCGGGFNTRTRECLSPSLQYDWHNPIPNVTYCSGESIQTSSCNTEDCHQENVIVNKAINCSLKPDDLEILCTAAIDGSFYSRASLQLASSGTFEGSYGLLVDLGSDYVIQSYRVKARNAYGCCYEGLRNVTIEVLDSTSTVVATARDPNWIPTSGAFNSQTLTGIGRYIRLLSDGNYIKQGESTLDFNELQVFGYESYVQSYPGTYISHYISAGRVVLSTLSSATTQCELTSDCSGVTQEHEFEYTLRRSATTTISSRGENSWLLNKGR
eukprot:Awhi_evm2s6576